MPSSSSPNDSPAPATPVLKEDQIEYGFCIDDDNGNGFVWHTTGSGKPLTSFTAATLLKENEHVHKCVFVVDRKDLDDQTREEFNRFQEGCVEENTNTSTLVRRLLSEDYADKVIVTAAKQEKRR